MREGNVIADAHASGKLFVVYEWRWCCHVIEALCFRR